MFVVQYEKPPQTCHDTLEKCYDEIKQSERKWLRIYEMEVWGDRLIIQNIYP